MKTTIAILLFIAYTSALTWVVQRVAEALQ
jgi:hypothetical protein